jgi:PAS domain S-box-containing protein
MGEKPTILIVDDDPVVRSTLENCFDEEDYVIETAEDGLAALSLIEKTQIDVALVDLKMPGIDGLELCRRIKKKSPGTEVIIVTGYGSRESVIAALRVRDGAFDYILKPPDLMEISHSVEQALEKRRLLAEREQFIQEVSVINEKLWQKEVDLEKKIEGRTGAIMESERKWRALFMNAPDPFFTIDTSGTLKLFNTEAERLSGYKAEEVEGKSIVDIVPRGSQKTVRELIDLTLLEGVTTYSREVRITCKDGTELVIETNTTPLYDENRQIVGGLATGRDITPKKQTEKKLRKLNRRLAVEHTEMESLNRSLIRAYAEVRAIHDALQYRLDSVNNAVLFSELDGTITGINEKTKELFGYSRDQLLKMKLCQLVPQSSSERTEEMLKKLRMGLSDSFYSEVYTKNKETLRREWNASVVERKKKKAGLIILRETLEKVEDWIKNSKLRLK